MPRRLAAECGIDDLRSITQDALPLRSLILAAYVTDHIRTATAVPTRVILAMRRRVTESCGKPAILDA